MKFVMRRLGYYLLAAWVAITANFLIPRLMPGNAVDTMIAASRGALSPAAINALRAQFGASSGSLLSQYWQYLVNLAHGNLGTDLQFYPASVVSLVTTAVPYTLILVGISTVVAFTIGTGLGILAGWRRNGWLDRLLPGLAFFQAVPYFLLAILVVEVFALRLGWFPATGGYNGQLVPSFTGAFITSAVEHGFLPMVTIVLTSTAGWMLQMRNAMIMTVAEDHVLTANAKGLSPRRVMLRYAARNAILPNLSAFALALGFVISGALVMEIVFSYPGIGLLLFNAVTSNDYPLVQAVFLLISLAVLAACFIADLIYALADPRVRKGGTV